VIFVFLLVIVNINVEIKLSNKTFKEELKNKSSPAYKELEQDVYVEVFHQNMHYRFYLYTTRFRTE
jgi:hypothetical protein